jgi:hypothetical protein
MMIAFRLGWTTERMMSASSSPGKATCVSTQRMMNELVRPPR